MTQQTHGTPELKYSEETFREMYEALKNLLVGLDNPMRIPSFELVDKASLALAKAEGREA